LWRSREIGGRETASVFGGDAENHQIVGETFRMATVSDLEPFAYRMGQTQPFSPRFSPIAGIDAG
jgi:hypothetical protein